MIEKSIIHNLRNGIESHTDFKVVNLRPYGINTSKDADFIRSKKGNWVYREDKAFEVKKLQK